MTSATSRERKSPRLRALVSGIAALRVLNRANPVITTVTDDSRAVTPGALFVAIKGFKTDGHLYIAEAAGKGAGAIVCEALPTAPTACPVLQVADSRRALSALAARFCGFPARKLRMTGVTGTKGKTTTTELLRNILNEAGRNAGSIGTLGHCIGDQWIESDLTTPGAVALHTALLDMVRAGATDVCMEVSSHSLVLQRVADVPFAAAILTNITHDHLDMHGNREDYARAKRMLFESLAPGTIAVLPADCEFHRSFRAATRAEVLTYSTKSLSDVKGRILSLDMDGMAIEVRTPLETYTVRTTLTGDYNCLNILAAATAAFGFGIHGQEVQRALTRSRGVPGRLERVRVPGRDDLPALLVDFAHTPDSLDKVLSTLRMLVKDKLVCLVGCGGDRDRTKRPLMGDIATRIADVTVFTADNSRSERTEDIIAQMTAGVSAPFTDYRVEPDRRRAIELAISLAPSPESMVVLCGRGCERYLKIAGQNTPFDDRLVAREIMQQMPLRRRRTA